MKVSRCLLTAALGLGLQACVPRASEESAGGREPVRWILVERRYGDLEAPTSHRDGAINPEAVVLAFQPLFPEDLTWDVVVSPEEQFVELVQVSPSGAVVPGEVVTATVRVGKGKPDQRYRLSISATEPAVQILGTSQALVRGVETVRFSFTSSKAGRSGIAVAVERLP